ncbi:MAG: T9SS type A sorting domain-containing protein [Candidatus Eisenbacteria bacterium]
MRNLLCTLLVVFCVSAASPAGLLAQCCTAPDNGSGTVDYPADCLYDHQNEPMMIINGLPAGSTITLSGPVRDFTNVVNTPGGSLGGEICTFDAYLNWTATGTGDLAGFNRTLWVPVSGVMHIGPRTPGDSIQSFPAKLDSLYGQLFGDPDFCELIVRAGNSYGLPSPGHTVLTKLSGGNFSVDSFFDITYEVQFEGCPGSQLEDYLGTTGDMVPRTTCYDTTYTVDWCRLQWPVTISEWPGRPVMVYGRLYIAGLTDQTTGNDPVPAVVRGQVGYGPADSDPLAAPGLWTWFEALPTPGWDGGVAGEPDNDEYTATLITPAEGGAYDFACRFSGDAGSTWLYGDKDTGQMGEDGSENGYQTANAGKMTIRNVCCSEPDNGSGTIDFPADCPYENAAQPMYILDGLPAGTTIELWGPLTDFSNVVNSAGGDLGGEVCTFDAYFDWTVKGTGSLAGFNRHLSVPVSGEIHIAARTPGDSIQTFAAKIDSLSGELFGDPDFCELKVRVGNAYGLPSPGQTILTELPSGDFNVDSFFDIAYEIQFEGCPASQLEDYNGTTQGQTAKTTCHDVTYTVDWCRLQWPLTIQEYPGTGVTVYGRVFVGGVTDRTSGNDPVPGVVRGQVGYGPRDSDPSAVGSWTWTEAIPNPGWNDASQPGNDEYMALLTTPAGSGEYDYAYRFTGDGGGTWLYGDKATGVLGEDGSENGYQTENAGKMTVAYTCCIVPDNGSGTADFPADCPYDHPGEPMRIVNGLPPVTTIELAGPLTDFSNVVSTPGGSLGGEIETFDSYLDLTVTGTGALAGFSRHLYVPVSGTIHTGPRTPGDSIQSFPVLIDSLYGQLFGDPDFCEFIVRAGNAYGLPSPGYAVLTKLPNGDFNVDSFFDIAYEIQFEGCPASQLEDYSGTTQAVVPRTTCSDTTLAVDWCRLQWPLTISEWPGVAVEVCGRVYIAGLTDKTTGNDPMPAVMRGQVGYGLAGSDPSLAPGFWTWFEALPNPGWDGGSAGESDNDEYVATLITPPAGGEYDFACRFSGDAGSTWLYGDKDTGVPGEDGSENGYQYANAGEMIIRYVCCSAPDNGSGTVDFPADCPYGNASEPMYIIDGLAPGTTIELMGPLTDFSNVVNTSGGSLGGEICTFDAYFDWTVTGTGNLLGFSRHLYVPVSGEFHIGPRTPGDSVQTFAVKIDSLRGELFGDPDFCELIVRAGTYYGLASSGQATLTELPTGGFTVDSFFDITYEIQFEGCPGSQLEDLSGTTQASTTKMTCWNVAGLPDSPKGPDAPARLSLDPGRPNPFRFSTAISYAIPSADAGSRVTIKIYDTLGRLVDVLADSQASVGVHHVSWNGTDRYGRQVASGVYFCRLTTGRRALTQRIVLLK